VFVQLLDLGASIALLDLRIR